MIYRFVFNLGTQEISEDAAERLFEAGCDDASPYCTAGVWHIAFDRDADHLEVAIRSAKRQVEGCGFVVHRIEVETE
jgi:hypothetical protein